MKKHLPLILIIAIILLAAITVTLLVLNGGKDGAGEPGGSVTPETQDDPEIPDAADYIDRDVTGRNIAYVTMKIKDYGEVKLLLDATSAPRTVASFLALAKAGFYDGLDFFSAGNVTKDAAIIIGGDPTVNGGEAAPDTVKGEFSANGIENDLPIKRGAMVMFYSQNPDEARSAFFFTNDALPDYDGYLAPFGYVVRGYKVIHDIINTGMENTSWYTGLIYDDYRPIITSITVDQDIDYSLVSDVYAPPLTDTEISSLLGTDNSVIRSEILSQNKSIYRTYISGNKYLFQLFDKIDGKTANILVAVDNNGKITGAEALSPTESSTATELSKLVGLNLASIGAADISADLKAMVTEALSADVAIHSPTKDNIEAILGTDHNGKTLTLTSAPSTIAGAFINGDNYLFHMVIKSDEGFATLLVYLNKDGQIIDALALPLTADALAQQVPSMIGLDIATIASADISDSLKTIARDSIGLVIDLNITAPTDDDIAAILGADNEATKTTIGFAAATIKTSYKVGEDYLFHMVGKSDDGLAILLVLVNKNGEIIGVHALPKTTERLAANVSSMIGLSLSEVDGAALPGGLKALAKDALNTVTAIFADDSASKYIYTRDNEDRETYIVEMKVQGYDTPVVILLDKTTAPITVEHFLSLVEDGFYDGLTFHRIKKNFMIQGGASTTVSVNTIKGEFANNGHTNDILHLRGTISMARANAYDSASSQFFICDADAPHLDGNYAAFGYVISGMETVDAIADYATGKTDGNGNLNSGVAQPTIEYIKIIEN